MACRSMPAQGATLQASAPGQGWKESYQRLQTSAAALRGLALGQHIGQLQCPQSKAKKPWLQSSEWENRDGTVRGDGGEGARASGYGGNHLPCHLLWSPLCDREKQ